MGKTPRIRPAGHRCQDHPQVIAEVRRILQAHLIGTGGADRKGARQGERPPSSVTRKGGGHG